MKKGKLSTILLIVVFLIGLAVLLYPTISNYINQFSASHAIANYDNALSNISQTRYGEILSAAEDYNRGLAGGRFWNGEPTDPEYLAQLNLTGNGMMGYVEIRQLKLSLPIYHGTAERVLQHDTGHLEGSSLPVGGTGAHAVITGHRGLPGAKLFTDLDAMEVGDTFTIVVLNEVLTYEVDQIAIVEPNDVSKLDLVPGKDHVTLVTCTPYAVNTHRLLVRGVRIEGLAVRNVSADATQIDPLLVVPILAVPILLVLLVWSVAVTGNRRGQKKRNSEY